MSCLDSCLQMSVATLVKSEDRLELHMQPSLWSRPVVIGSLGVGLGAALYAIDCCCLKVFFFLMVICAVTWILGEWEDAVFDKKSKELRITSQNVLQKFLCCSFSRDDSFSLDDVSSISCDLIGHKFVLNVGLFNQTTIAIGRNVRQCNQTELTQVASEIQDFLQLDERQPHTSATPTTADDVKEMQSPLTSDPSLHSEDTASVTSSEESFEQVTAADLAECDESAITNGGAIPVEQAAEPPADVLEETGKLPVSQEEVTVIQQAGQ